MSDVFGLRDIFPRMLRRLHCSNTSRKQNSENLPRPVVAQQSYLQVPFQLWMMLDNHFTNQNAH